jgi:F-type H+-transporting ATPase subunit delta
MVRHDKIAHRYAKAFFDHVGSGAKARELVKVLKGFADIVASNPQLSRVLTSHLYSDADRRPIVEEIAKKTGITGEALKMLLVLSGAKRLGSVGSVADRLQEIVLDAEGVVPLWVESAHKLDAGEREKIEKKFSGLLGKKVEANYVVDPSVLGGLRVTASGRSYNGTLSGWLGAFQERLVGG